MSICELLAPAGSPDALRAAAEAGADSVYLGGSAFNARRSAVNFDNNALSEAIDYCHLHGIKVFVTVNTLVNDREIKEMTKYLKFLSEVGADGIIVQDLGVARIAKETVPDLALNASTQMTVFDKNGAMLLQNLGFKRVVLARELSLKEITEIRKAVDIELEVFAHGAICVCYSGQCLMSSFIGGRSGNRGACAQPCRLNYSLGNKNGHLLSPKDMGLIRHLDELKKAGVNSLKIEGRMKGPDYVRTVVSIYRKYLDEGGSVSTEDYDALNGIFFRGGLTDGYLTGNLNGMMCYDKPDNPYLKQKKFMPYECERKRDVDFYAKIDMDKPAELTAVCGENTVTVTGTEKAQKANNKPLDELRVVQQLSKLGQTVFKIKNVSADIEEGCVIPVSELNGLRREAVRLLEEKIISSYKREKNSIQPVPPINSRESDFSLTVFVSNEKQAEVFKDVSELYVPINIYKEQGIAVLPRFDKGDTKKLVEKCGCKKVLIRNIGQLWQLKDCEIDIYADYTLNIFNSYSAQFLYDLGVKRITLSTELSLSQIRDIKSRVPLESVIYGYIPLMITKNCLIKPAVGCKNHKGAVLTDRTGTKFKVMCTEDCKNEIYNSLPVMMSDKMTDIQKSGLNFGRLMFNDESPDECREIYNKYKTGKPFAQKFTRGKFYKGVL